MFVNILDAELIFDFLLAIHRDTNVLDNFVPLGSFYIRLERWTWLTNWVSERNHSGFFHFKNQPTPFLHSSNITLAILRS